jgi:hypothetical protein
MAVSAAASAKKTTTLTNKLSHERTRLYKVPGEGLDIYVAVGHKNIMIRPSLTRDGDKLSEFRKETHGFEINFPAEAYGRAWRDIESSELYKSDDEFAIRIREAFNYALDMFERKYKRILR